MTTITLGKISCELSAGESVLEGLERSGVSIPNSCRAGACQSCLVQSCSGDDIPATAQVGLKDTYKRRGYFLACMCKPERDMALQEIGAALEYPANIAVVDRLSDTVTRLRLQAERPLDYEPGQFITLIRSDGLARSYSIASLPSEPQIDLHIRRIPGGQMSTWAHSDARPGDRVAIRGPHGECFYTGGDPDRPLILAGTGTGLAPLWGIARHALVSGHRGPIAFIHGALDESGLYFRDELAALARDNASVTYIPCVVEGSGAGLVRRSAIDAVVRAEVAALARPGDARAYICGDPGIVNKLKRVLFLAGLSIRDIFADAFVTRTSSNQASSAA